MTRWTFGVLQEISALNLRIFISFVGHSFLVVDSKTILVFFFLLGFFVGQFFTESLPTLLLKRPLRMCRLSNCSFHAKALYSWLLLALFLTISWNTPRSALCQGAPAAKTEKEIQVDALIVGIREHSKNTQWDLVVADCTRVLEIDPINTSALLLRGIAHNSKKNFDRAIEDFDSVGRQTARDSIAVANRADAFSHRSFSYYQKTDFLKAIDSAFFAILEKSDHAEAHSHRAMAYMARQQFTKAIQSADRAIGINDKNAEAYSLRGLAYAATNNLPQAIADQNKAIALAPALAVAFQRRAEIHLAKNDAALASADIDQALRLNPGSVEALCDRAYLFGMQSKRAEAMADLDAAITIDPQCAKAHYIRGLAYMSSEDFEKAAACFDETIRCQEKHALAYCSRGYANHAQEKYEAALNDFTKAIDADPKLVNAYQGRAKTCIKLKMRKEANADLALLKTFGTQTPHAKDIPQNTEPPRFVFLSKEVDPARQTKALQSAKTIDALVEANHQKYKVAANPATSDEQFVRRMYLDITGTIPTFLQTQKFLHSTDSHKRSQLIDQLLGSDGYASHFFNYWADILRYTDSLNGNVRGEPYRQWIKQSLAENKPWNVLVHELLTAEGLVWTNPATGYLQRDASMPLDNMNNTIRIFLGTRIGCAQCHNHPFDRWTQKEFYQMAAFTFGTHTQTGGADTRYWKANPNERLRDDFAAIEQEEEDRRNNTYRFDRLININMMIVNDHVDSKITLPKDYAYSDAKPSDVVEPKTIFGEPVEMQEGETPRKAFARWLVSKENPRFARTIANRLWKRTFGVGLIEPVDDMQDSSEIENPELMKFLESEMIRLDFDMKEFLRILYNSQAYQRQACEEDVQPGQPYHFPGPMFRRMTAEQVWDSFLTLALPVPYGYRELPSHIRTDSVGIDLNNVTATEVLTAETESGQVDGGQGERQKAYMYKGLLLARASELPSPVPANHFLRVFGQSDRELISASSTTGSVPQVLCMFNGPITHMLLEQNSTIYNNISRKHDIANGVKTLFLTILSRLPESEELALAQEEVKRNGAAGYGNVVWSLVNTREFLFIQ